ncbi:hypothetical protein HYALB_00002736 [Hymenoscyphus albidus]|uniref:Uncharacterized protein n=1 Tax=Hymenoscyphus albidus TaxID=595503 RepID=A0A9N9M0N1_9HELO|nr:hypothetical protein HYALB_00002736 [Hymenoscyphus albidus]
MRTSIPYLSLTLYFTTLIQAFISLSVPKRITAGIPTEILITNDLDQPTSTDATTDTFRIYLWHNTNMCYLLRQCPISTTKLNINIPPSAGPNDHYILVAMQVTLPPHPFVNPIFTNSAGFNLTGATGSWSKYETSLAAVRLLTDPDRVPCEAMACARDCVVDFDEDHAERVYDRAHYECLKKCPGVDYPSWEEYQNPSTTSPTPSLSSSQKSSISSTTSLSHDTTNTTTAIQPTLTPQLPPVAPLVPVSTGTPTPAPTKSQSPSFAISMEICSLVFICVAVHLGVWRW